MTGTPGYTADVTEILPDIDKTAAYEFKISLQDSFGRAERTAPVSVAAVIMNVREDGAGIGFGKISEMVGYEFAGEVMVHGNIHADNIPASMADYIVEEGISGFWQYIKLENGLIFLFTNTLGITMPAWESLASLYWRTVEVTVPEVVSTLYASFGDMSTDYARWTRCNGNWGGTKINVQQYSMNANGNAAYTRLQGFVVGTWKE